METTLCLLYVLGILADGCLVFLCVLGHGMGGDLLFGPRTFWLDLVIPAWAVGTTALLVAAVLTSVRPTRVGPVVGLIACGLLWAGNLPMWVSFVGHGGWGWQGLLVVLFDPFTGIPFW